jgi:phosphosulfolactate phosphohydrolase-like enzyme
VRIARSFSSAEEAFRRSANPHERDIEDDLAWCARESVSGVVPRFATMVGPAAEIVRAESPASAGITRLPA